MSPRTHYYTCAWFGFFLKYGQLHSHMMKLLSVWMGHKTLTITLSTLFIKGFCIRIILFSMLGSDRLQCSFTSAWEECLLTCFPLSIVIYELRACLCVSEYVFVPLLLTSTSSGSPFPPLDIHPLFLSLQSISGAPDPPLPLRIVISLLLLI